MDRTILHCDMNNFYASVELLEHPELLDVPVVICGNPENRHGIVLAKNQPAKKMGIVTAETLWQARKKCPGLVTLPPHMGKYKWFSKQINDIYSRYTDMVEPFSIDESWLDVTHSKDLFGSGTQIADEIRETVKESLGLTLSVGVSFNKIFAKMGSEYKKPDATVLISRENFKDVLWPLDISEMFFVGDASTKTLREHNINTIGDLAKSDRSFLIYLLGRSGQMLYDYANGLDDSPVLRSSEREKIKSVGHGMTFRRNLISSNDIMVGVTGLSERVAFRLRKYELKASGVKVEIKGTDLRSISRQKQLSKFTDLSEEIKTAALELIKSSWPAGKPIRLLSVTAINLHDSSDEEEQLDFLSVDDGSRSKLRNIERTVDHIRARYGSGSIQTGRLLNNDLGMDIDDD